VPPSSDIDSATHSAAVLQLAIERERLRMAGQLHDEVGAHLLALRLALARVQARVADAGAGAGALDAAWLAQQLAQLEQQVLAAQEATRRISHDIWPPVLALGLFAALAWLAEQATSQYGVPCRFEALGEEPVLAPEICHGLFLICQEALQNIAKHAQASQVDMLLACDAAGLDLKISDNGSGMPSPAPAGFGLRQMQARASAMGARLTLAGAAAPAGTNAARGTLLHLQFPASPAIPTIPATPDAPDDHD
jgi:signal transduction histidine kinase